MLLRTGVMKCIDDKHLSVHCHLSLPTLMQHISETTSKNKVFFAGVAGAGESIFDLLRIIRKMRTLKVKTIIWVSPEYIWLNKLLSTIHVRQILDENDLISTLPVMLDSDLKDDMALSGQRKTAGKGRGISMTELEILFQSATGLSPREIAEKRGCNHKTIFSWKHNICESLELTSHNQWLDMLSELAKLASLYRQGQRDVTF
jgi:Bacterial regulatory proteins, luxR family.